MTDWKIRTVFDTLNQAYHKFYNPSENLAMDEVIVKFQGRVIFWQYILKKMKLLASSSFSSTTLCEFWLAHVLASKFTNCDESGYTYDMRVCLGKDSRSATDDMTATHATIRHLTCRFEGLGHKLFMDNFFSSPRLFDNLLRRKIHSCGTVRPNRKDVL